MKFSLEFWMLIKLKAPLHPCAPERELHTLLVRIIITSSPPITLRNY